MLKKSNDNQLANAFKLYKSKKHATRPIKFSRVWGTLGALGLPFTFFGLIKDKDLVYDSEGDQPFVFRASLLRLTVVLR